MKITDILAHLDMDREITDDEKERVTEILQNSKKRSAELLKAFRPNKSRRQWL